MFKDTDADDRQLDLLSESDEVDVSEGEDGAYIVAAGSRRWLLWPLGRCWVEINADGVAVSSMQYGTIERFNLTCALRGQHRYPDGWSQEEINVLFDLVSRNLRVASVADILGRSVVSVVAKARTLLGTEPDPALIGCQLRDRRIGDVVIPALGEDRQTPSACPVAHETTR